MLSASSLNQKSGMLNILQKSKTVDISKLALWFLILLLWADSIIVDYVEAVMIRIPFISYIHQEIIGIIYIALIICAFPAMIKKARISDVIVLAIVFFVCISQFLTYPKRFVFLCENIFSFLFLVFPFYFIGISLDYKRLVRPMYQISIITIFLFALYAVFIEAPMSEFQSMYEGDMWAAYNLLPHVCLVVLYMLKKANIMNVCASLVGFIMLLFLGTRGPLLCLFVITIIYVMFIKKYKRPLAVKLTIVCLIVAVMLLLKPIMTILAPIAKALGLSVRIFDKFLVGNIFGSSGRDVIAEKVFLLISQSPFRGYGLFSDRILMDAYCHNLAYELCVSFGLIVGIGILLLMVIVMIRAFIVAHKDKAWVFLFLTLFAVGGIKLFLSGSFLDERNLYLLIGFCVSTYRGKPNKRKGYESRTN